jgi:2-amino-4-hydroxy-6-hydroxymethyldihydropteridine diphosphokinase
MNELHKAYLNLGSNIQPELNLVRAIHLLEKQGEVPKISNAWESESVGARGPNYLNVCMLFVSHHTKVELKKQVIQPIETQLGRKRTKNKYIPRTIDIDIILFDDQQLSSENWGTAFVIVPLSEIYPEYQNPITGERITETAARLRQREWIEPRPEKLRENNPKV